jgi:hypothetical protein
MGLNAGLTGLTHLDLFGARITDAGTNCFRCKCTYSKDDTCGLLTMLALKNAAAFLARGAVSFLFATILQEHCIYLYQWLSLVRNLAAF